MAWAYTLEGINPTLFNFVSDVVSVVFGTVFTVALGHAFVYLMSKHIRGKRSIPAKVLGKVPPNFASSTGFLHLLKWSAPALVITFLLAIGDFSHSIADLGLSFVTVPLEAPPETVLTLQTDRRNQQRLFELSGDPWNYRTSALPTRALNAELTGGDFSEGRRDRRLIENFLVAIDDIALGGSPLAEYTSGDRLELAYGGLESSTFFEEKPLAQINFELPLNCATNQMVPVPQIVQGAPPDALFSLENVASVPDCSFNVLRSSGILNGSNGRAEILEYSISHESDKLALDQLGSYSQTVTFTPLDKALARDRDNWKQGRLMIRSINGAKYGDLEIRFDTTALATGSDGPPGLSLNGLKLEFTRSRYYFLVSNVFGECPPLPSGRAIDNVECLVVSVIFCNEVFQEDIEPFKLSDFKNATLAEALEGSYPVSADSTCDVEEMNIIWGRNFVADAELVAVLSGVITRARLNPVLGRTAYRSVTQIGVLAALFALASTEELPSIDFQVRPRINLVYITFMFSPLLLAAMMYLVTFGRPKLPIPTDPWELLVLGREERNVPKRGQGVSEFPNSEALKYEFAMRADEGSNEGRERLGIHRIQGEAANDCLTSIAYHTGV